MTSSGPRYAGAGSLRPLHSFPLNSFLEDHWPLHRAPLSPPMEASHFFIEKTHSVEALADMTRALLSSLNIAAASFKAPVSGMLPENYLTCH